MLHPKIQARIAAHADAALPVPQTLAQAFVDSTRRYGQRLAIQPLNGSPLSYDALAEEVRRAVAVLQGLGLAVGDRIAICLPNDVGWSVFTYACALLGLCVVPVNLRYRPNELAAVLQGSKACTLVTQARFLTNDFLDRLQTIAGGRLGGDEQADIATLPEMRHILLIDGTRHAGTVDYCARSAAADVTKIDLPALAARRHGAEPMWMFWTSGSTSAPKGALLPQSAIAIVWQWTLLAGYRPDDRVLTSRPLFYIAGHYWTMLGPMLRGALSVVAAELTSAEMQRLCRQHGVTVLSGNPLMMKNLIEQPDFDREAFTRVRLGYFGGSSLTMQEMRVIRDAIGYEVLMQTYGMTELGGFATSTLPDDSIEVAYATCGYPFTGMEFRLLHAETDVDVPDGAVGVLLTRGQPLIDYVNLPAAERAKVFTDDGWFRTGDLARFCADGRLEFCGRVKDLIKVGGENVTAIEIETLLMRHPDVVLAVVVGVTDSARGEVPLAFVELREGATADSVAFLAWCKGCMAPYKVPADLHWVGPGGWPMTASGKIAKHELLRSGAARRNLV